jgi:hypothetical protein
MVQNSATRSQKIRQVVQYIWSESTYGHGPDLENFIFNFLYAEFHYGQFKPIPDE